MKLLLALLAGAAIGVAINKNRTVYIHTTESLGLSKIPDAELEARLVPLLHRVNRKGIYFH